MPAWSKDNIARHLLHAAGIALHYYDNSEPTQKADGSVVTRADHEIERYFQQVFDHPSAGTYLLGEETQVRFRPHFFPFTEPSVEYDFSCSICGNYLIYHFCCYCPR